MTLTTRLLLACLVCFFLGCGRTPDTRLASLMARKTWTERERVEFARCLDELSRSQSADSRARAVRAAMAALRTGTNEQRLRSVLVLAAVAASCPEAQRTVVAMAKDPGDEVIQYEALHYLAYIGLSSGQCVEILTQVAEDEETPPRTRRLARFISEQVSSSP